MADRNVLLEELAQVGGYGQNKMFGPSYFDSFQNSQARLNKLNEMRVGATDDERALLDQYTAAEKANRGSAVLGGGLAAINGLTSIFGTRQSLASTNDTDWYDNQVNQLYDVGRTNYDSFDQLVSDYTKLGRTPDINYNDVRGMNTGQKIAGVGSSTLSGAMSGWQVGGLYGAIAGAAIGLGAGIDGWISGDQEARNKVSISRNNAANANEVATINLGAADERYKDYKFRNSISGTRAEGGPIRRQQSINEFADSVLKKQRSNDRTHSAGLVRKKAEGGTMIRLKVK